MGHIKALTLSVLYVFGDCVIMYILIHYCILTSYSFYHHQASLFTLLDKSIDTFIFYTISHHFNFNFFGLFICAAFVVDVTFVSSIDAFFKILLYQI